MSEEIITYNIVYNVSNINDSIRSTQRMLYFTNALRLSIVDIQQVMAGPTFANVMWTSVQLTRVWTNLYRMISATNKAQAAGGVAGAFGGRAARGRLAGGLAAGQSTLFGGPVGGVSLTALLTAFAVANPILLGAAVVTLTVSALGYRKYFMDRKARSDRNEFIRNQREIAKIQGYDY